MPRSSKKLAPDIKLGSWHWTQEWKLSMYHTTDHLSSPKHLIHLLRLKQNKQPTYLAILQAESGTARWAPDDCCLPPKTLPPIILRPAGVRILQDLPACPTFQGLHFKLVTQPASRTWQNALHTNQHWRLGFHWHMLCYCNMRKFKLNGHNFINTVEQSSRDICAIQ